MSSSFLGELERQDRWRAFPGRERGERRGAAVLTFDDGPDPQGTPLVLDALDEAGVRATFFVVGEQLLANPRLGRTLTERGHEVALHGHGHVAHDELAPQATRDDLARGLGTAEVACGRRPRFYRPPYGLFTEHSHAACADLGLEPVLWSAWGLDWEQIPAERVAALVIRDLSEGAIVLLHDSARYAPRAEVGPTADAIGPIAQAARDAGLELVTLGEALV